MSAFFITGTDTGVGKTFFTAWLVRSWRAGGWNAAALKPVSTGDRDDAVLLREASGGVLSLDETNPIHLREPAAPLLAARLENRHLDFTAENRAIASLCARFSPCAVEGVGGWRTPLAPGYDVRDWASELALPVAVVALNRLGVLNHTLLTVESIRTAGLECAGVVLNDGGDPSDAAGFNLARSHNAGLLRELLLLPVFEFDHDAQASGQVPPWLEGKKGDHQTST